MPRKFQIGDTVRVKPGTIDPDFGFEIGGWHGQVTEIDDDLVCIELDSITLSEIPDKYTNSEHISAKYCCYMQLTLQRFISFRGL